ncbi:MAG: pseudouridine synthase, partial [Prevotellaceae bacterium]|nr:pseudouridine synthase [Prevotellaceae bacterium]
MTEELENRNEGMSAEHTEGSREGYNPTGNQSYRNGDKPMRPRIRVQRAYTPNRSYNNNDEGGFRPEGFGANLQSDGGQQRSYRPRYNSGQQEGGYQPRQNQYGQRQNTGYRPRYNNNNEGEGGYQPRQGGYQPRQNQYGQRPNTGYRPRYNNNDGEGGYQPRQGGYQRQGGY